MVTIENAQLQQAEELLEIYAWYVQNTAITFEWDVPSLTEFRQRIADTQTRFPWLVLRDGGRILGYGYLSAFHPRKAYEWCAETSIYLDHDLRGKGYGWKLYEALEEAAGAMGILNLNACIACPKGEADEYLSDASIRFHEHLGYSLVGEFHDCGFKFSRWYDMVWMEKMLGIHEENPAPVIVYPDIAARCDNDIDRIERNQR